jgi:hypothetical protein
MAVTQEKKTITTLTAKCDVCDTGYTWVEEDLEKDPLAIPEGAARLLAVSRFTAYGLPPNTSVKMLFCSKFCLLKWLNDYEPARLPSKEELEKLRNESTNKADVTS